MSPTTIVRTGEPSGEGEEVLHSMDYHSLTLFGTGETGQNENPGPKRVLSTEDRIKKPDV